MIGKTEDKNDPDFIATMDKIKDINTQVFSALGDVDLKHFLSKMTLDERVEFIFASLSVHVSRLANLEVILEQIDKSMDKLQSMIAAELCKRGNHDVN